MPQNVCHHLLDLDIRDPNLLARKANALLEIHQSLMMNSLSDNLHTTIGAIWPPQQRTCPNRNSSTVSALLPLMVPPWPALVPGLYLSSLGPNIIIWLFSWPQSPDLPVFAKTTLKTGLPLSELPKMDNAGYYLQFLFPLVPCTTWPCCIQLLSLNPWGWTAFISAKDALYNTPICSGFNPCQNHSQNSMADVLCSYFSQSLSPPDQLLHRDLLTSARRSLPHLCPNCSMIRTRFRIDKINISRFS